MRGQKSSHHKDITLRHILSHLLMEIREGNVQHHWAIELSRLSRNDMVAATIRNECNKAGVTFYTKDGQYDLNNPLSIFTRQILGATSQLKNALRAECSETGRLQKVRQVSGIVDDHLSDTRSKTENSPYILMNLNGSKESSTDIGKSVADIKAELDQNGVCDPTTKRNVVLSVLFRRS